MTLTCILMGEKLPHDKKLQFQDKEIRSDNWCNHIIYTIYTYIADRNISWLHLLFSMVLFSGKPMLLFFRPGLKKAGKAKYILTDSIIRSSPAAFREAVVAAPSTTRILDTIQNVSSLQNCQPKTIRKLRKAGRRQPKKYN
jgi:hypothetical protein